MDSLIILLWNVRSLIKNLAEFQKLIDDLKPHLICLTETWLKPNIRNLKFKNFDILRNDRLNINGGGVAILIRKELNYKAIPLVYFQNGNLECLATSVNFKHFPVDILTCYCPPGELDND